MSDSPVPIHHVRRGSGAPLLLVHGLGSSIESWSPIMDGLAAHRTVIAPDLPGHGRTPPLSEETVAATADALEGWMREQRLEDVDMAGSSMGARLVLEMARRGLGRDVVALDPGGFWTDVQAKVFHSTLFASVKLVRAIRGALPTLLGNPVTRTALLAQLSAAPWRLDPDYALSELRGIADTASFFPLLDDLANGPRQEGMSPGTARGRQTLVWGRRDLVTPGSQSDTATDRFPDADLEWIDGSGHFPHWDRPEATLDLLLSRTGSDQPAA